MKCFGNKILKNLGYGVSRFSPRTVYKFIRKQDASRTIPVTFPALCYARARFKKNEEISLSSTDT